MEIYYIGCSPCSGKSTMAEMIAAKYGYCYYKLDDHLFDFMKMAAEHSKPRSANYFALSPDGIWLRSPEVQCEDEIGLYREMFEFFLSDIERLDISQPVIAEGAGFLPELMMQSGVDAGHYFCMVPTSDFQIEHYQKREFVPLILQDCTDRKRAFDNWMKRDILFAKYAAETAGALGYKALWVDGSLPPEAVLDILESHFMLK